jgi:hypothetical protein
VPARVLTVLALGALLLVPSASHAATTEVNLSGVITRIPGGIEVAITNNGPDLAKYVYVRMNGGEHTDCSADEGGACADGGDANTVRAFWASFPPGVTRHVRIMTKEPYRAGAGAQLLNGNLINSPPAFAGTATGPPPAPPPPPKPKTCKCTSLTARIVPQSLRQKHPLSGNLALSFDVQWTIKCTKGSGGCTGGLTVVAPQQKANTRTGDPGYTTRLQGAAATTFTCTGKCGKSTDSKDRNTLRSTKGLLPDARALESIPIVISRACRGQPPVRLSIAFDRDGRVDLKESKLG